MATNAVATVFSITELVEAILLHLEPKDVVVALWVTRSIKDLIIGSKALKRKLFITPESCYLFQLCPFTDVINTGFLKDEANGLTYIAINPILGVRRSSPMVASKSNLVAFESDFFMFEYALGRRVGKWGETLLSQPPAQAVTIHYCVYFRFPLELPSESFSVRKRGKSSHTVDDTIDIPDGVRVRHILERIRAAVAKIEADDEDTTEDLWHESGGWIVEKNVVVVVNSVVNGS